MIGVGLRDILWCRAQDKAMASIAKNRKSGHIHMFQLDDFSEDIRMRIPKRILFAELDAYAEKRIRSWGSM